MSTQKNASNLHELAATELDHCCANLGECYTKASKREADAIDEKDKLRRTNIDVLRGEQKGP